MTDWKQRSIEMHRRAQKAEGLLMKLVEAHETGIRYAEKDKGYVKRQYIYGCFVMDFYKSVWKKAKAHILTLSDHY